MEKIEAANILDPNTNVEALRPYINDCEGRIAAVSEALALAVKVLREAAEEELHDVKSELSAAVEQMRGDCDYCKYLDALRNLAEPCKNCARFAAKEFVKGNYWEWKGPGKE